MSLFVKGDMAISAGVIDMLFDKPLLLAENLDASPLTTRHITQMGITNIPRSLAAKGSSARSWNSFPP